MLRLRLTSSRRLPRLPAGPGRRTVAFVAGAALGGIALARGLGAQDAPALPTPPTSCFDPNPFIATTCFARGTTFEDEPAVVLFRDSPDDTAHYPVATIGQVGSLWGLAYDAQRDVLYAAAYHKRNTHYGPLGPGGIYGIHVARSDVTPLWTVPNAGSNIHDDTNNYQPDDRGRNPVSETSLGDIDLSDDGKTLFVMNLYDKKIYRYDVGTGKLLGSFFSGGDSQAWRREARPFALAVREGWVFHGVVNSQRKGQSDTALWAYVFASKPDGTAMRKVASLFMGYDRGPNTQGWRPWPEDDDQGWRRQEYPLPLLTDIEFNRAGDMILGFRDRYIDTGPSLTEVYRRASGDVVLARKSGTLTWEVEDLTKGEFYTGDDLAQPGANNDFAEITDGGLTQLMGRDVVVSTAINPFRGYSDGAVWFDNATGGDIAREELLYNRLRHEGPQGKMQGLGDAEQVCFTPPTPTPTNTAPTETPTPTETPSPSVVPSATPTETPTRTSTPDRYRIYLPQGETICLPKRQYVDVVLVLDRSTSMLRPVVPGGVPKNEAAIDAAKVFVDLLELTPDALGRHDNVAVVGFNDTAWTEVGLTNDRDVVLAVLEGLRSKTAEGTRLDLALTEGQRPLEGPGRVKANLPVMILLTDGLPNRVPTPPSGGRQEDTVLAAATAAKDRGTMLFTIGLGTTRDIYPRLMIAAASEPWAYHYAPQPEDLAGIYAQIADVFIYCDRPKAPRPTPCVPEFVHTDVVLALDMSTSMYRTTRAGRTKHAAAIEAAKTFVRQLDFEPDGWAREDTAAVVGFNDTAWTSLAFSDRPADVETALDRLLDKIAEGTRLDLALAEAGAAMARGPRTPENHGTVILLTDGLPNRVPTPEGGGKQEDTVLAAAAALKATGARLFTIGLGEEDDVFKQLLRDAASSPEDFFFAPDGEDLEGIYRQIAGRIRPCP